MKTRIILDLDFQLSEQERVDLKYLLADAVGEFSRSREPVSEYISRRYANYPDWLDKDEKEQEVFRRITLANRLHNALLTYTLEDVEDPHDEDDDIDEEWDVGKVW